LTLLAGIVSFDISAAAAPPGEVKMGLAASSAFVIYFASVHQTRYCTGSTKPANLPATIFVPVVGGI
jgi:hypothetical protein